MIKGVLVALFVMAALIFVALERLLKTQPNVLRTPVNETILPTPTPTHAALFDNSSAKMLIVLNLEHRKDRQTIISNLFAAAGLPIRWGQTINPRLPEHRHLTEGCFDTRTCPGQVGCQMSHIWAIEKAIRHGADWVAVVEDDFMFHDYVDPAYVQSAFAQTMALYPDWDVIAASLNTFSASTMAAQAVSVSETKKLDLVRIHDAQTTTFYIARNTIFKPLLKAFKECEVKRDYSTAIDQCWKPLQHTHLWIGYRPQMGTQGPSFSDIESVNVNYGF